MIRRSFAGVAFLLTLILTTEARAGWVQPSGAYYLKFWDRSVIGGRAFDLRGEKPALPENYQDHALNLYVEYGLTSETTVVFNGAPLGYSSYGDEAAVYSGLNWAGLRFALLRGEAPLALELKYGYSPPFGAGPLASGTVDGASFIYRPALEQHLARGQLSAGWALTSGAWLKGAFAAIFSSNDEVVPALEASLGIGWRSEFGLAINFESLLHLPARDPRVIDVIGVGNTRYLGVELTVAWWFSEHFGIHAALGGAPALARSNAAAPALSLGVEIRS